MNISDIHPRLNFNGIQCVNPRLHQLENPVQIAIGVKQYLRSSPMKRFKDPGDPGEVGALEPLGVEQRSGVESDIVGEKRRV